MLTMSNNTDPEENKVAEKKEAPAKPEPKAKKSEPKYNKVKNEDGSVSVYSENFVAFEGSRNGQRVVTVAPIGWVGPAPLNILPERKKELAELLSAL